MVAAGPKPGKHADNRAQDHADETPEKFIGVSATEKPSRRLDNASMGNS